MGGGRRLGNLDAGEDVGVVGDAAALRHRLALLVLADGGDEGGEAHHQDQATQLHHTANS